jgi:hypothetical protein
MVNLKELRIGNIILHNGQPAEVLGVGPKGLLINGHKDGDSLEPLPLSNYLLEQLLGKYPVNGKRVFCYYKSTYFLDYEEQKDWTGNIYQEYSGYYVGMYDKSQLIHVTPHHFHFYHELQNVYFAQFGTEIGVSFDKITRVWINAINIGRI